MLEKPGVAFGRDLTLKNLLANINLMALQNHDEKRTNQSFTLTATAPRIIPFGEDFILRICHNRGHGILYPNPLIRYLPNGGDSLCGQSSA